jgi:hypothetical protein
MRTEILLLLLLLLLVLYGYESEGKNIDRGCENEVPRKIFGPKKEELKGGKLHSEDVPIGTLRLKC